MDDETLYGKTVEFNKGRNALVFIHGGAWIDVNNTPWDFQSLCQDILKLNCQCGLYGIEYRLSPSVQHPTHLKDVIENLYRLVNDNGLDQLQLVGHSVGATLAWQVATCELDNYKVGLVKTKLNAIWLVDGIYSIRELLDEYPDYDYFVSKAFDEAAPFEEPGQSVIRLPQEVSIRIVHSYEDELLSLRQSRHLIQILETNRRCFHFYIDSLGSHNQVYSNANLAQYIVDNVKFT
ncbi:hypothetical protein ZYGR_0AK05460 [Zygosaccharomyces rouxii]|uniref:Alpha/beta hydrolase fold-3 domain-containing protein n=1 Tax=Zygosaccharomyces rouxii TaxID=4956 RepID=A0A1Q3AE69_ZYGRO|nr:hypothetical protein ZYGR_0AK05460 [Zygosaccharomyces rouxii]